MSLLDKVPGELSIYVGGFVLALLEAKIYNADADSVTTRSVSSQCDDDKY